MSFGSYQDTCRWLCRKYNFDYKKCYQVVYHKYFCQAVARKMTELQSFSRAAKELGIKENGQELRAKHLSFQKLNKSVFNLAKQLKERGYKILLLSKNTPGQFNEVAGRFGLSKYFDIINTYCLGIDKGSPCLIKYILKKYKLKPQEVLMSDDQDFNLINPRKIGVNTILYKNFGDFKKKIVKILEK